MPYALCSLFQNSLRGVGPYGPYGFRLVDRAYSSERPEAAIHNPKSKIEKFLLCDR
jgi:hypothetical protein